MQRGLVWSESGGLTGVEQAERPGRTWRQSPGQAVSEYDSLYGGQNSSNGVQGSLGKFR